LPSPAAFAVADNNTALATALVTVFNANETMLGRVFTGIVGGSRLSEGKCYFPRYTNISSCTEARKLCETFL
jgi:hypothetical protein